jgi:Cu(I)/Ag(I) efflux system membrane fusion protein
MGIRTQSVNKQSLSRTIHTIGSVSYNEDTLHHIHSRANGWIEKVYVKAEGDEVKRGSTLVDFYSPDIVVAEKDLLIAKKSAQLFSKKGSGSLLESARQKLRLLDVPESIIKQIQKTGKSHDRVPIVAPQTGVITKMGIRDGMYVTPKLQMYTIADLSSVWVLVDVFEHQMDWVKKGNKVEMNVQGLPGEIWKGKVDYIYPELSPVTRTLKVRLKFDTPKQRLKPNMFANVTLFSASRKSLSIPTQAIIYYENSTRVVKVTGDHQYQPVEVKTGMKSDGQVEIIEGLQENDRIVVSGQFMIDSESNLQASFRRLAE